MSPSKQIVKTFVQISDLHIGPTDPETQQARVPWWLEKFPHLEGLRGHNGESLRRLEHFFARIREEESAQLIVTGDITACGATDEYDTARTYLEADLKPPKGEDVGLQVSDWTERAVPGNHDQWSGKPVVFGGPPPELWDTFKPTPFVQDPEALASDYSLRILGINTDAQVNPHLANRPRARGSFRKELGDLGSGRLALAKEHEIRVLLLHHSSQYRSSNSLGVLEMTRKSRQALFAWMADHGISILLCGHTHLPKLTEFPIYSNGIEYQCFEACCGATTILTSLPYDSTSIFGGLPRLKCVTNSLLVHRLWLHQVGQGTEMHWCTETFFETPSGFKSWNKLKLNLPSKCGPYFVDFRIS